MGVALLDRFFISKIEIVAEGFFFLGIEGLKLSDYEITFIGKLCTRGSLLSMQRIYQRRDFKTRSG